MSEPHNPDRLSDAQIGASDGWRLLDNDEVILITSIPPIYGLESWVHERWDCGGAPKTWRGNGPSCTYRTCLSRPELRAARGLPPISEPGEERSLFKSDDEMLIALTGSAKEVVLKNPDGSTWTPAAPAPAGDDTCHLITQYLGNGGLFNPEMMDHDRVRDLLMKCRDELSASRREVAEITRQRDAAVHWAAKLSKQLIKTDEDLGTAAERLHAANRANEELKSQLVTVENERDEALKGPIPNREVLGKIVRKVWISWAMKQPNPKPSWLVEWADLSEPDREVDRQIGETLAGYTDGWQRRLANDSQQGLAEQKVILDAINSELEVQASECRNLRAQLATVTEQLQAAASEEDKWDAALTIARQERDAAESRARAAEAACDSARMEIATALGWQSVSADNPNGSPKTGPCGAPPNAPDGCLENFQNLPSIEELMRRFLAELEKAKKDGALIDAVESACWDVRCEDIPTGQGDADVGWTVIEHHMAAPHEREVGIGGDTVRAAIRAAIAQKEAL